MLCGQDHGLNVSQGDSLLLANIENQLFQFIGNHHHVAAKSINELPRGIEVDLHILRATIFTDPTNSVTFFYPRQFDDGTILTQRLPDALIPLSVRHVHTACIRWNADVIGDKNHYCIRIRIFAVGFDASQFFVIRSAAKQALDAANKEDLKRRH